MAISAVLFDLDGTLLDTAPDFATALNRLLVEEGKQPLLDHTIGEMVTGGSAALIEAAFNMDSENPEFEPLRQRLLEHYRACIVDQTRLFPGLDSLLQLLESKDISWGIVTNKPETYSVPILLGLELQPAVLICPDHVTRTKPDPEPVFLACRKMNCSPKETVFIGDHVRDIESGNRAGATTVAAAYGYIPAGESVWTWNADHVVTHSRELQALIEKLL